MTRIDEQGRPEPPFAGEELASLLGFLDFQRATFAWKCDGVDAAGLRVAVGVSAMTLGGLLKHLAFVEDDWFGHDLLGLPRDEPWAGVAPGSLWRSAADDDPAALRTLWRASVERSRERVAVALADGGLDRLVARPFPDGVTPSLRWVLLHMIEEYARHNGHADLLREAVDGAVGE